MKNFKVVFKQMFLQKRKYTNLVLLVEAFTLVFISVCMMVKYGDNFGDSFLAVYMAGTTAKWWAIPFGLIIPLSFLGDAILIGILSLQNEKIKTSQIWHLGANSDTQLWFSNILSSLANVIYAATIQFISSFLLMIPLVKKPFNSLINGIALDPLSLIEEISTLILLVIFVLITVSVIANLSRMIVEIIPTNSTWIRLLVVTLVSIMVILLALNINQQLQQMLTPTDVYHQFKNGGEYISYSPWPVYNLEMIISSLIFTGLDLWLMNKYIEPKKVNF